MSLVGLIAQRTLVFLSIKWGADHTQPAKRLGRSSKQSVHTSTYRMSPISHTDIGAYKFYFIFSSIVTDSVTDCL